MAFMGVRVQLQTVNASLEFQSGPAGYDGPHPGFVEWVCEFGERVLAIFNGNVGELVEGKFRIRG